MGRPTLAKAETPHQPVPGHASPRACPCGRPPPSRPDKAGGRGVSQSGRVHTWRVLRPQGLVLCVYNKKLPKDLGQCRDLKGKGRRGVNCSHGQGNSERDVGQGFWQEGRPPEKPADRADHVGQSSGGPGGSEHGKSTARPCPASHRRWRPVLRTRTRPAISLSACSTLLARRTGVPDPGGVWRTPATGRLLGDLTTWTTPIWGAGKARTRTVAKRTTLSDWRPNKATCGHNTV